MPRLLTGTPREHGFAMPAEWQPHRRCYLVWPERPDNWRLGGKPAQAAWVDLASAIATAEPVTVLASRRQWRNARARLPASITVLEATTDDCWVRDTGPTFVTSAGQLRAVDWQFNAWGGLDGGLYFPWDADDLLAHKISELEGADRYRAPLVLEGGAVDVDGTGTALATAECLLHPNRNPRLTQAEIEGHLRDYLGLEQVIWLPRGVHQDETDGHIDNLARFIAPGVVALTWTDDRADPQHERSAAALEVLSGATDTTGRLLRVVRIHQPGPLQRSAEEAAGVDALPGVQPRLPGERLPASYVNCYLGNGIVVLPLFGDPRDADAREVLQHELPGHRIVGVASREILLGGGNIHCVTQQVPAAAAGLAPQRE